MKIIDLLNKIANGGEVPKKIKYNNRLYTFDEKKDNYYENETCSINWDYVSLHCLNEKVEIIEEEKKIPEKLDIQIQNETTGNAYITNEQGTKCYLTKHSKIIAERLNQVIDYLQSKGDE